jgi:hypothetical protein
VQPLRLYQSTLTLSYRILLVGAHALQFSLLVLTFFYYFAQHRCCTGGFRHLQCMAHAAHEALSSEAVPLHAGGPKLKVLVVTFNLGNAPPSEAELKDWLPVHEGYDVIAFGLQESTYNMRKRGRAAVVTPAGSAANSPTNRVAAAPAAAAAAAAVEFTAEDSDDEEEVLACATARISRPAAAAATMAAATELLNRDESFTPERATCAESEAVVSDGSPPAVTATAVTAAAASAAATAVDVEDVTAVGLDDSAGRVRGSRPSSGTTQAFKRLVDAGAVHLRGLIRGKQSLLLEVVLLVLTL